MTDETTNDDTTYGRFFDRGDAVRNIQNPHLTGIVIGERNWGDEYNVRLADGARSIWWLWEEIEHDDGPHPEADEIDESNVIDFATRKRALN